MKLFFRRAKTPEREYTDTHVARWVPKKTWERVGEGQVLLLCYDSDLSAALHAGFARLGMSCLAVGYAHPEEIAEKLKELERPVLLGVGDTTDRSRMAEALGLCDPEGKIPFLFHITDLLSALTPAPRGERMPTLTFTDPALFSEATEEELQAAHTLMLRLGMCLNAGLFRMIYATYSPLTCLRLCRTVLSDMASAPDAPAHHLLSFGEWGAKQVSRLPRMECTHYEALAMGMLLEMQLGVPYMRCHRRTMEELEGALTYYGLPRLPLCTPQELTGGMGDTPVTLSLPESVGHARLWHTRTSTLCDILHQTLKAN